LLNEVLYAPFELSSAVGGMY